jgi:hypothetical protein
MRRKQREKDVERELRSHLELEAEEQQEQVCPPRTPATLPGGPWAIRH